MITRIIMSIMIIIVVVSFVAAYLITDNTDTDGWHSSGLSVYTDNLTGCQYLGGGLVTSITPRLNGSGKQVGCR